MPTYNLKPILFIHKVKRNVLMIRMSITAAAFKFTVIKLPADYPAEDVTKICLRLNN